MYPLDILLLDPIAMGDPMELGPAGGAAGLGRSRPRTQQAWEGVPVVNLDTRMRDEASDVSDSDGMWDGFWLAWLHAHRAPGLPTRNVEPLR